ncbi:hypothetical protein E1A91_A11G261700v1 [Gossypium mustelinum]|uniref:Uncharacterized protein LOC107904940 isoform X2 n=3 Tax=Gossypium TaxID=3633 RepID=A0A1U8JE60_GOSHI|nr:uncharacterized protein LOC107904940 isoform X2 [Gossypium hirsutum]XP_040937856.1 uncharacterized protein LOC107904940 isoform X2 [Gossypium hirsutum]TYG95560.1 hypothetical protein ES288_A11G277400v1 [Gossypium darwinii]TYJ11235.1 hypothetical protein E1A91_A11G261700v1 [Gossypium mustelinum]TYJ11236.1 hypothetical protein E1A91_A11G261700v1 [Gossypium mustelinum]
MRTMKADEQMVEEQPRQKQRRLEYYGSFGGFSERDEKAGIKKSSSFGAKTENPRGKTKIRKKVESSGRISKKKLNNLKVFKKAKKRIRKVEVEIAEMKGYTKCLKQWIMEETTIMESAILEMEIEVGRVKRMNGMLSLNDQIINDYIKRMLGVFEAEDHLVSSLNSNL